ncbi:MAG: VacB/RNase II family 3'-5' exoribonuclease [Phycisphaerales bacterium]
MALRYEKRLLQHLGHEDYEPKPVQELAAELGVEDVADFAQAIEELAERGVVAIGKGDRVALPGLADRGELVGIFRATAKGFGFVQPEVKTLDGDIFIPPDATAGALAGDRVKIVYARDYKREKWSGGLGKSFAGEVIEVVERKRARFTGEIYRQGNQWLAHPDGREITTPIVVRDAESKNVKAGDKVAIEILEYPEGGMLAEGVIVKVLGEAGDPDVETQAVIAAYSLPEPDSFPESCVEQAREATREFDRAVKAWETKGASALELRRDLTGEFICTIDPPDAKDYDDAISIKRTEGGWELGIHIADVATFIPPGSALDVEGYERGNSCYLPRLVIPMLPEVLSNGICSLQEGVPRFAKSAIMSYDRKGNLKAQGVCSSLIKSRKRMTYLEAQALIDGDLDEARKHAKTEANYTDELIATVKEMDNLARAIRERRRKAGMIHLDLPDVNLIFDENGRVVDAEPEDDAFTHTIIEMFMVEANEALARLFEEMGVPLLRRVHPEPTPGDVDEMRKTAKVAGFNIPKNPTREELQVLLDSTAGTPNAWPVHMAVLRTLTKAEYSPALIGHYALASAAYAHFTSPIRRYPDLTVHRALAAYLARTDNGQKRPRSDEDKKRLGARLRDELPTEADLITVGRHCSTTEQNAEDAERQLRQFLVLQLLAEHIGEEFAGIVTGINPRGVFVQLEKYLADGMVSKENLVGDTTRDNKRPKWVIDDRTGAMVDAVSGRSYNIGDKVRVFIAQVDLAQRKLDLAIAGGESRSAGKAKGIAGGLNIGGAGAGGMGRSDGAGFGSMKTPGGTRRSRKSKSRDKHKSDYRQDRKGKGKRQ